jgi:hypothetical protein
LSSREHRMFVGQNGTSSPGRSRLDDRTVRVAARSGFAAPERANVAQYRL